LGDKKEAQDEGGRRFQKEGPVTENDLDLAIVVLVQGIKRSDLPGSVEDEGMRQRSEGVTKIFRHYPQLSLKVKFLTLNEMC